MFHVFRLTAAAVAVDHTAGKLKTFNKTTTQLLINNYTIQENKRIFSCSIPPLNCNTYVAQVVNPINFPLK